MASSEFCLLVSKLWARPWNWKEFTSDKARDRCLQEVNLLCCWLLSTLYTRNNFCTVSGAVDWSTWRVAPSGPCISCRFNRTRDGLSQVVARRPVMVGLTAACSFRLKMFKFSNRKGKARQYVAIWERYVFARFMSVQKRVFVRGRGERVT